MLEFEGWKVEHGGYCKIDITCPKGLTCTVDIMQKHMTNQIMRLLYTLAAPVPCKYHKGSDEGFCAQCADDNLKDNQV